MAKSSPSPACPDPLRKRTWPPASLPSTEAPPEPSPLDSKIAPLVAKAHAFGWCQDDGTYVHFDDLANLALERGFQARKPFCELTVAIAGKPRRLMVEFRNMSYTMDGSPVVRKIRRWTRELPVEPSWDYQDAEAERSLVCRVLRGSYDYTIVEHCLFRADAGSVTRDKCAIVAVRRIQNLSLLARYRSEREILVRKRGAAGVNEMYLFHGTRTGEPLVIAGNDNGFMTEYGNPDGFYGGGCYFAEYARYSHSYAFRTSDPDGQCQDPTGSYFHLLLVQALCGQSKVEPSPWSNAPGSGKLNKSKTQQQEGALNLGGDFDSVRGGPHTPARAGPGPDDSAMYVVYKSAQTLPEFLVTYTLKQ